MKSLSITCLLFSLILSVSCEKREVPSLPSSCINLAKETIMNESLVRDADISIKEYTITLVLVVNAATNTATAQEYGDRFLRLTKSLCNDGPSPTKEIGKTNYDYQIGVFASGSGRELARGAKVDFSPRITW